MTKQKVKGFLGKFFKVVLVDYLIVGFLTTLAAFLAAVVLVRSGIVDNDVDLPSYIASFSAVLLYGAYIFLLDKTKSLTDIHLWFYNLMWLVYSVYMVILIYARQGYTDWVTEIMTFFYAVPFFLIYAVSYTFDNFGNSWYIMLFIMLGVPSFFCCFLRNRPKFILNSFICFALLCVCICLYQKRPIVKYDGYGFEYMYGYSSTDFTGYNVYDGEKLAVLDHTPSFTIKNKKDMPVLDGAEACYPLYCAAAKAVYKNIDKIELRQHNKERISDKVKTNGKIVTFTNTAEGYWRLIKGYADIVFGARPSNEQKKWAAENGKTIVTTPIAKEAFVFFVEPDNPINDLSADDIRKIYSGEIKNWKELGGSDEEIIAYQRPENSGSQVVMRYFMGDTELEYPVNVHEKIVESMANIIDDVATHKDDKEYDDYGHENGAIGYSFRYFVQEMQSGKKVKLLSVDGVYPSLENIENGTYPITADVVMARLKENKNPNIDKMIGFMLSDDGKELIRKTGYAPVENTEPVTREEVYEEN